MHDLIKESKRKWFEIEEKIIYVLCLIGIFCRICSQPAKLLRLSKRITIDMNLNFNCLRVVNLYLAIAASEKINKI